MSEFSCANHGGERVEGVCGECGEPLCGECVNNVRDPLFDQYEVEGYRRVGLVLLFLVGVPLLLNAVVLDVLIQLRKDFVPQTIVLFDPGLLHSAIILGIALIPTTYYRTSSSRSGFRFVRRKATERILCDTCANERGHSLLYYGILGLAVFLGAAGIVLIAQSFDGRILDLTSLRISAIGAGIYVLRNEITYHLSAQLE